MKINISLFLANMSRKLKFDYDGTRTTSTVQKYLHIFLITSPSISLRMKNILVKRIENQNKKFYFYCFPKIVSFMR